MENNMKKNEKWYEKKLKKGKIIQKGKRKNTIKVYKKNNSADLNWRKKLPQPGKITEPTYQSYEWYQRFSWDKWLHF